MKIAVINGSPKGQYSITLQTILYLQKKNPKLEIEILHAAQMIRSLENDFTRAKELLDSSDAVIFSYPVYTFIAPSQLHRFIELMKEHNIDMTDKYVTQLTTSKHFYDVTAHKYIEENMLDMGVRFIKGLSADMDDLLTDKGKEEAEKFLQRFLWSMEYKVFTQGVKTEPTANRVPVEKRITNHKHLDGKDVVIVTDCDDDTSNLYYMIKRFRDNFKYNTRLVNINELKLNAGCLGCFRCAVSGNCVHKDGFDNYLRVHIQTTDAIVYAFEIKDHSMGSRFKMYDDRNFCNGHRTVTEGMPVGYIISGDYSKESNLQMIIEGRAEVGGNFLCGIATDEFDATADVEKLSRALTFALDTKQKAPRNFLGIGGNKIFRDLIWQMRGMMRADHKFYKEHKHYDFPQKKWYKALIMYPIGWLLSSEKIVAKMGNKMNEGMIAPYKRLFKQMDRDEEQRKIHGR